MAMADDEDRANIRSRKSRLRARLRELPGNSPERKRVKQELANLELKYPPKLGGRPRHKPDELKSPALSFRTKMPLFERLKESATAAGRTLTAEAERRLEASFSAGGGMRDPYESLAVPRSATAADIKKSFRELAKRLHPDANKNDEKIAELFTELNAAYAVLGDRKKRGAFDRGDLTLEKEVSATPALSSIIQGAVIAAMEKWTTAIFTRLDVVEAEQAESARDAATGLVSSSSQVTVERSDDDEGASGVSSSLPDMQKLLALYKNKAIQNNKLREFALQLMALAYQEQDPNTAISAAREMLLEMVRAIDNGEVGEGTATLPRGSRGVEWTYVPADGSGIIRATRLSDITRTIATRAYERFKNDPEHPEPGIKALQAELEKFVSDALAA
jgi:curved DNA-binding protein CbpA